MIILPIHPEVIEYLKRRQLFQKFRKQRDLFLSNPSHPSLNVEILEPKHLRIYSFRIDKKYRATFIFRGPDIIEIIDANNHYK